jgi:hypothetical protein
LRDGTRKGHPPFATEASAWRIPPWEDGSLDLAHSSLGIRFLTGASFFFGTVVTTRELIIIATLIFACAIAVRLSAGELLAPDMRHLIDTWLNDGH